MADDSLAAAQAASASTTPSNTAIPDTARAPTDTLAQAAPATTDANVPSASPEPPGIEMLAARVLEYVTTRYPEAPQAERATQMHNALQEALNSDPSSGTDAEENEGDTPPSSPGSAAEADAPTSESETPARSERSRSSTETSAPERALAPPTPASTDTIEAGNADRAALPPDSTVAAWTVRVEDIHPSAEAADSQAVALREQMERRLPVQVKGQEAGEGFYVAVGTFDTRDAAERVRGFLQRRLQHGLRVVALEPAP